MKLFGGVLKVINDYSLIEDSDEYEKLVRDVKAWEDKVQTEDASPLQKFYKKIHEGIWLRLCMPFIYFWARNEIKYILNPKLNETKNGDDFYELS